MDTDDQNPSSKTFFSELICPESQIVEEIWRLVDIVNPKKSKTNWTISEVDKNYYVQGCDYWRCTQQVFN